MATPSEAGEQANGLFPPFDPSGFPSQLFWLAITFGVLYFAMSRLVLPKIGGAVERRQDKISTDLEEAASLNEKAVSAQQALELKLAEARARARETAASAKAEAEAETNAESNRVEAELEDRLTAASERIAKLQADAMQHVETAAATTASAIARELAGLDVSDADAAKAVSSVLKG